MATSHNSPDEMAELILGGTTINEIGERCSNSFDYKNPMNFKPTLDAFKAGVHLALERLLETGIEISDSTALALTERAADTERRALVTGLGIKVVGGVTYLVNAGEELDG